MNQIKLENKIKFLFDGKILLTLLSENKNNSNYKNIETFINKFVSFDEIRNNKKTFECKTDGEVYELLAQIIKEKNNRNIISKKNAPNKILKRENYRAIEISDLLERNKAIVKLGNYLDYGANGCLITKAVSEKLQMNAWASDIPFWSNKANACKEMNITYADLENGKIPNNQNFPDKFDLITVLMVLHHIPKEDIMDNIKDIINRISENKYLLVREHDVNNKFTEDICHIEHIMYDIVKDQISKKDFINSYTYNYNPISYWIEIIESFGLKLLYKSEPVTLGKYVYLLFQK